MITPQDRIQAAELEALIRKLEKKYYPHLLQQKNDAVEIAAENYEYRGYIFQEYQESDILVTAAKNAKLFSNTAIVEISAWTQDKLKTPLRPSFTVFAKEAYFQKYGLAKSKEATQTTFRDIKRVINIGIKEGKGSREVARDIRKIKTINRWRAETIARTEIGFSQSFAQQATIEEIDTLS